MFSLPGATRRSFPVPSAHDMIASRPVRCRSARPDEEDGSGLRTEIDFDFRGVGDHERPVLVSVCGQIGVTTNDSTVG